MAEQAETYASDLFTWVRSGKQRQLDAGRCPDNKPPDGYLLAGEGKIAAECAFAFAWCAQTARARWRTRRST
jgi:hypothetical protein